jgi:hypothetical protein
MCSKFKNQSESKKKYNTQLLKQKLKIRSFHNPKIDFRCLKPPFFAPKAFKNLLFASKSYPKKMRDEAPTVPFQRMPEPWAA